MRYQNETLRDKLASEYVLGTLGARARARFVRLMRYDPRLRASVAQWEERLGPMAAAVPEKMPPARVWRRIQARIETRHERRDNGWTSLALWRALAAGAGTLLLVVVVYLGRAPQVEAPLSTVAVLADAKQQPILAVSWPAQASADKFIKVKLLAQPDHPADKSWELWMLPGGDRKPISMGLIGVQSMQTLRLSAAAAAALTQAAALAISVEPRGGSPTGQPTGPVILQGRCVKLT